MPNIKLQYQDCLMFLKNTPSDTIDLILTDPPYNISKKTGFQHYKNGIERFAISMDFGDWDRPDNELNIETVIQEFYRVLKPRGTLIIFYDIWKITPLSNCLTNNHFKQLRLLEWQKTNPVPINSKINYLTNAREIAISAVKNGKPTFNSQYDNGVYQYPIYQDGQRFHPTQKPVNLFIDLINKHSNQGDIVLDCFAGSGTTAIACQKTKREFVGCENNLTYYNKAIKRLENLK